MTKKQLQKLIAQGESQTVEFKKSLSLKDEIGVTISAFANTGNGTILIGISDDGKIQGLTVGKKTDEDLANWIKQNTDPKVYPDIKIHQLSGKKIITVSVKESTEKPVFYKDRAYQRVGKTSQRISASKIRELAQQQTPKLYWDQRICEQATLKDIDEEKVEWFLEKARYERRLEINPDISVREALEKLELTKNGRLTNAAVLLFGKNPQKFFLQAETRCARFKGTEPLEFIDMKVFRGNVIDQREDSVEFVKEHIKLHAKIVEMERVERWEYPIEAIREAITNAVCHRDYEMSANVQVRIFDDRIEIWGCGSLPEPQTVEDLKVQHRSILRNRLIGKCFFLIKFIEQWGTGTNRIIKSCLNQGLPEPVFEERSGGLVVSLRKYNITEEMLKELNERQRKAIEYLLEHKKITNREYREVNPDITDRTALNDLNDLVERGIVIAKGKKKYRYYTLC